MALVPAEGSDEAGLLAAAASVQALSEHPLARAVVRAADAAGIAPMHATGFRSVTGRGALARWRAVR